MITYFPILRERVINFLSKGRRCGPGEKRQAVNACDKFMLPANFELGRNNHSSCVWSTVQNRSVCHSPGLRELWEVIILRGNLIVCKTKILWGPCRKNVKNPKYMWRIPKPTPQPKYKTLSRRQSWREVGQDSDMPINSSSMRICISSLPSEARR